MAAEALTKEEVYERIYAQGETVKSWAEKHGYEYHQVVNVATGRNKATRGLGLEIAFKLGMKTKPKALNA